MNNPSPSDPLKERLEKIISGDMSHLVSQLQTVEKQIKRREFDRAIWRLVDIAGTLSEVAAKGGTQVEGWSHPTGRGYQITKRE